MLFYKRNQFFYFYRNSSKRTHIKSELIYDLFCDEKKSSPSVSKACLTLLYSLIPKFCECFRVFYSIPMSRIVYFHRNVKYNIILANMYYAVVYISILTSMLNGIINELIRYKDKSSFPWGCESKKFKNTSYDVSNNLWLRMIGPEINSPWKMFFLFKGIPEIGYCLVVFKMSNIKKGIHNSK